MQLFYKSESPVKNLKGPLSGEYSHGKNKICKNHRADVNNEKRKKNVRKIKNRKSV